MSSNTNLTAAKCAKDTNMDKSMEFHNVLEARVADYLFRPVNNDKVIEWKNAVNAPVLTGESQRIADELIMKRFDF